MARFTPVLVWLYVIIGTVLQVSAEEYLRPHSVSAADAIIFLLGVSEVTLIGAYFMHLKYEQRSLLIVALLPIVIIGALIAGILVSIVS